MANLPAAPNPADYSRPVSTEFYELGTTVDIPLTQRLLGIVEIEGRNLMVFIQEGESEEYVEAQNEYQEAINEYIEAAAKAGVMISSLADLEKFAAEGVPEVEDTNITQLFGIEDEDE